MKSNRFFRSTTAALALTLATSLPAAGASLHDDIQTSPTPLAAVSTGHGIVSIVHETTRPSAKPFGETFSPDIELRGIVHTALLEFEVDTALGLRTEAMAHTGDEGIAGQSAEALASFGISNVSIPDTEQGFTWRLLPSECVLFVEVAVGIMLLGFVPATFRRVV
ncbi:MAG: hypothetical protein HRU01_09050 [Myxococcales bacterium]|nr:hypothetical protein [Myxococcales bacterium]